MICALLLIAGTRSTTNFELTNKQKTSLTQLICNLHLKNSLKEKRKTSRRLDQDEHIRLCDTSSRRLQVIFKTSSGRLGKISLRRIFQTFSKCIIKLNCCCQHVLKTSSRRFHHVFLTYWEDDYLLIDLRRSHV